MYVSLFFFLLVVRRNNYLSRSKYAFIATTTASTVYSPTLESKQELPYWSEIIQNNTRKNKPKFMPINVSKTDYDSRFFNTQAVFVWNGATPE